MIESASAEPVSPFDDGELYDILFEDLNYARDFYIELARIAKGPVLELACGTGRVLLPCMQAGADVDGLDFYRPMLDRLEKKARTHGLMPNLIQADMADFKLPRKYALVTIAFNAFIHNLTQQKQIRCLELCREHLLPGGILAFDSFFPGLGIIGAVENTRVLELEKPHPLTGRPLRVFDTRVFDRVEQIQHSINEVETDDANGNPVVLQRSEFSVRWIYKAEMELLLRAAGFVRSEIAGDFSGRPLTLETDAMVVKAWADA